MKRFITAAAIAVPLVANAAPIDTVSAVISGDIRDPNIATAIDVRVDGAQRVGDNSIFDFDVDFSAAMRLDQPDAKMQQFYFNLFESDSRNWDITGLTTGWTAEFEPSPVPGAGGGSSITFTYGLDAPGGGVTGIDLPLEFALQYFTGADGDTDGLFDIATEITDANFLGAATSVGDAGSGQLGVKVGGLVGLDDVTGLSGFGFGNYQVACADCGPDPQSISSPGSAALLCLGLIGLMRLRRSR
jgi:opacity protein-like surface antigen